MSITASRFGSSPLLLDWSGLQFLAPVVTPSDLTTYHQHWTVTIKKLHERVSGFYDAVIDTELSQIEACTKAAAVFLARPELTDCIFIGIGGSSLGPMCLIDTLKHKRKNNQITFHFFENPDPIDWQYRIEKLNPAHTLICVVTKSGTTYETLAIFMLAYDWLINGSAAHKGVGKAQAATQTIAITDPEKGELKEFCDREKIQMLTIAQCVGGRFSIFTPVGLFVGALAGLDMIAFLTGAKKVRDVCEKYFESKITPDKNLFITWAHALQSLASKNPIHVMMPYATPLRLVANWWVQLWAESLGKDGKGFSAIPALGAIDQHSMLQLLRDGPNDKVIWFINVQDFKASVKIPSLNFKVKSFELLEGQDLASLLTTEFRAVQKVMANQKRPSLQLQIDEVSEESIGALLFTLSVLTAYMGDVMQVNPFDQPGVEEGKVYIRERLIELKKSMQHDANTSGDDGPHRLRLHRE